MMAILHGDKGKTSSRGDRVPEAVAQKYADKSTEGDAPESKGKEHKGGKWSDKHHKKHKSKLNKALEGFIKSQDRKGAGCLVIDGEGRILLIQRSDTHEWATPGGSAKDAESHREAALRELTEETGLKAEGEVKSVLRGLYRGHDSETFLVTSFHGDLKNQKDETMDAKWFYMCDIPWKEVTDYTRDGILAILKDKLHKSSKLEADIAYEELNKNIIRSGNAPGDTVYELTHGDALKLVGNGTFRFLRNAVKGMGDEDFKEVSIDSYTLHIRKHTNDVYSGRIVDGHKQIHQFTNRSLPAVTAELMSVFEWYSPEDEEELEMLDESDLSDDAIEGGLSSLVDNYKKHNLSNIYTEMENIREEIRQGNAVDLQQVEHRIMSLFDKLEETVHSIVGKHNEMSQSVGCAVDEVEDKLRDLQNKIDDMSKKPTTVQAFSTAPKDSNVVHAISYPYLTRPSLTIAPSGHIKIDFGIDWSSLDQENFLQDIRAKVVKQSRSK